MTWRLGRYQPELLPDERSRVVDALRYFDGHRYQLLALVVMNDHVHVIVQPTTEHRLEDLIHSWKSFTAHKLQRMTDRRGALWQDEYFDRVVRDELELQQKVQYILGNPWKRWPELGEYPWVWALGNLDKTAGRDARPTF